MVTTIQLDNEVKDQLDSMKIHRETYNDLLIRILKNFTASEIDQESLAATVEVMSDPELMKGIHEALNEEGGIPLSEFRKELISANV